MLFKTFTKYISHSFSRLIDNLLLISGNKTSDILNSEYIKDGYKDPNYIWDGMFVKTDAYGRPIKSRK
jgi:hypothetical protein